MVNLKKEVFKRKAKVKVYNLDLVEERCIENKAWIVMKQLKSLVSEGLFEQLRQSLFGFNSEIQLRMAYSMLFFVSRHEVQYTGCLSVDAILSLCYLTMGSEMGIVNEELINKDVL